VTIAKRPSCEAGRREVLKMICPTAQTKWLRHVGTTGKSALTFPLDSMGNEISQAQSN
jgi:hypothetical protein